MYQNKYLSSKDIEENLGLFLALFKHQI